MELLFSDSVFRLLYDSMSDAILLFDAENGCPLAWNRRAEAVLLSPVLPPSFLPEVVSQENVLQENVLQENVLQENVLQENVSQELSHEADKSDIVNKSENVLEPYRSLSITEKQAAFSAFIARQPEFSFPVLSKNAMSQHGYLILEPVDKMRQARTHGWFEYYQYYITGKEGESAQILLLLQPRLLGQYRDKYPLDLITSRFLDFLVAEQGGDSLTGLPDRNIFQRYWQTLQQDESISLWHFGTLFFCDLFHFKQVNDFYGHQIGDKILIQVAQLLKLSFPTPCLPARFGGDEFLILCPGMKSSQANEYFLFFQQQLNQMTFEHSVSIQINYGLADYSASSSLHLVIDNADRDYYRRKMAEEKRS